MLKCLSRLLFQQQQPSTLVPGRGQSRPLTERVIGAQEGRLSEVVYPPSDPGIPIQTPELILAGNADVISMLKLHAAAGASLFATRFEGPLARVAALVNVLPGSATTSFAGSCGLFRAALETSFASFRASDGRIFTGAMGVEDRHKLEGRWRYVCFIAGLLYPIGGSLSAMAVMDARGARWAPEIESLTQWATLNGVQRLYVTWHNEQARMGPAPSTATFTLALLGRENIEWLNEGSPELIAALINIVTGVQGKPLVAASLVKEMWEAVQGREMARRHQNYGRLIVGSHISPYLIDAMVALSNSPWRLNELTLFADASGVYLEWPQAGQDIIEFCNSKSYPGIPSTEAGLLAILILNNVVLAGIEGVPLVPIADGDGEIKSAVKLTQPGLLLPEDQTLASFVKSRAVEMTGLRSGDPPSRAQRSDDVTSQPPQVVSPPPSPPPPSPRVEVPTTARPTLEQLDLSQATPPDQADEAPDAKEASESFTVEVRAQEAPDPKAIPTKQPSAEPATRAAKGRAKKVEGHSPGRQAEGSDKEVLIEGQAVRYSDLLPAEVNANFRPFEAELLGRLVHTWRTKANGKLLMRMCEKGIAFDYLMISEYSTNPVSFIQELGQKGYLHVEPRTPSKSLYDVPVEEGSAKTVSAIILAHHAARKLGLP